MNNNSSVSEFFRDRAGMWLPPLKDSSAKMSGICYRPFVNLMENFLTYEVFQKTLNFNFLDFLKNFICQKIFHQIYKRMIAYPALFR